MMKYLTENPWLRMLAITALLGSALLTTGCGGCRGKLEDEVAKKQREEEEQQKKKEKPKDDFETREPVVLPGHFPEERKRAAEAENNEEESNNSLQDRLQEMANSRSRMRFNRTKNGHWVTANFQVIANNYNAECDLVAQSITANGREVPIPSTDYFLVSSRPASLPKGEWKNLETNVFLPRRDTRTSVANIRFELLRTGGLTQINLPQPTSLLKPFQQHMVLLSERPESYKFLEFADPIHLRGQSLSNGETFPPFYYLVGSVPGDPVPLPRQSLNWTTIAYLIWDDFDPDKLGREQQVALVDWIHFGGQLILSGPGCLDRLQNSFLADYLPAQFEGSVNLTNDDLVELNKNWSIVKNETNPRSLQISDKIPLLGVRFKPHVDANFIDGTGEIAIERRIGRGRIVATAFSINAPIVAKWQSFPSFLNNALLRKPARKFGASEEVELNFVWIDDQTTNLDPLMSTTLRYLSRDLSRNGTPEQSPYSLASELEDNLDYRVQFAVPIQQQTSQAKRTDLPVRNPQDHLHFGGFADAPQSGPCGWNDDSGISIAARETLKEAAGITPPSSGFVLQMLAAYLVVLVPINWAIFRLMGRVEWAWIAAPFIAIVGAVLVVKMASLDIGFVRSNTQIGLLEVHGGYPRAHATEYSALYTSLSTGYNVDLDNPSAQSLPFARVNESQFVQDKETTSQVTLRRTSENRLEGFQIQSNSTGLLHTEFMLDLQGAISCRFDDDGKPTGLNNGSFLDLSNIGILYRDQAGNYSLAWVGELAAEAAVDQLTLESVSAEAVADRWHQIQLFSSSARMAEEIWNRNVDEPGARLGLEQLQTFPELADDWPRWDRLFRQMMAMSDSNDGKIDQLVFQRVFQLVKNESGIRLGRVFDCVVENLQLAPGECRMIATTNQKIGQTRFEPEATQTDQQTLVVVHLKHPPLPIARRDENALTDFVSVSDLDWQREMDELDGVPNDDQ